MEEMADSKKGLQSGVLEFLIPRNDSSSKGYLIETGNVDERIRHHMIIDGWIGNKIRHTLSIYIHAPIPRVLL